MPEKPIQMSEFKAKCIATLKEVARSGEGRVVTLRGRPLARLEPIARGRRLGALAEQGAARGDLVGRDFAGEWEMNRSAKKSR